MATRQSILHGPLFYRAFVLWGLLLFSMSLDCQKHEAPLSPPNGRQTLRLGVLREGFAGLVGIAHLRQYFQRYGLDVRLVTYASSIDATKDLGAGKVDVAMTSEFGFAGYVIQGAPFQLFAAISQQTTAGFVARRNLGVSRPRDLQGKRVGFVPLTHSNFTLDRFLLFYGLTFDDIQPVGLSHEELPQALLSGRIDALAHREPVLSQLVRELGSRGIRWDLIGQQPFYLVLLGQRQWLASHREPVRRLLRALLDAEHYVQAHPAQARRLIAHWSGQNEEADIAIQWPRMRLELTLEQALLLAMEDVAEWYFERQEGRPLAWPNFLHYISLDEMLDVKKEAVTIVAGIRR
jgi:NitT/TauT family transport system substrate-binding protein